jgi:FeS assembly SUF system regulator
MLRLSKMTDYGIVLLAHVASCPTRPWHTARDLSAFSHLPLPTVSKVVKTLVRAGLLESRRGAKGGYTLARPAESLPMVEVITALEGPVALTACAAHPGTGRRCDIQNTCPTRAPWHRLNALVIGALANVTLADMNPAAAACPAPLAQTSRSLT